MALILFSILYGMLGVIFIVKMNIESGIWGLVIGIWCVILAMITDVIIDEIAWRFPK